jgi:hypothetical protein
MPIAAPKNLAPKKKRTLLPVLTILFVLSYALMTLLIIEQGRAIQNQHNVIEVLMRDSTELWSARGKALHQKATVQAQTTPAPSADASTGKSAAEQTPSTQVESNKKQSNAQRSSHAAKAKPDIQLPPTPAADLLDRRRSLSTI